jgi:hypothetical protein
MRQKLAHHNILQCLAISSPSNYVHHISMGKQSKVATAMRMLTIFLHWETPPAARHLHSLSAKLSLVL